MREEKFKIKKMKFAFKMGPQGLYNLISKPREIIIKGEVISTDYNFQLKENKSWDLKIRLRGLFGSIVN